MARTHRPGPATPPPGPSRRPSDPWRPPPRRPDTAALHQPEARVLALTTVLLADLPQTFEDLLLGILGQHPGFAVRSGSIAEEGLIAAAARAGAAVVVVA